MCVCVCVRVCACVCVRACACVCVCVVPDRVFQLKFEVRSLNLNGSYTAFNKCFFVCVKFHHYVFHTHIFFSSPHIIVHFFSFFSVSGHCGCDFCIC